MSDSGLTCLVLDGYEDDLIRVLDIDFYDIKLDVILKDESGRFCAYCTNERIFYILTELKTGEEETYSFVNYLYNVDSNDIERIDLTSQIVTTTTTTTLPETSAVISVTYPENSSVVAPGQEIEITWTSSKAIADLVKIELYRGGVLNSIISESTQNDGLYKWTPSENVVEADNYQICITWLAAENNPDNTGCSDGAFVISRVGASETTETTTPKFVDTAIGIRYSTDGFVLIALENGLFGIFHLEEKDFDGMNDSGITGITSVALSSPITEIDGVQTKARVFVGSQPYWSDKWDSGDITTRQQAMYYGGGNNLEPGHKYYVHIRTYLEEVGWGDVQIQEIVMPN